MAVKPAHKLTVGDAVLVKDKAGAVVATRNVSMVRRLTRGTLVKFGTGTKLYRVGERVNL